MTTCTCGHIADDHGRADAQTAWQRLCWRDDCDCEGLIVNPNAPHWRKWGVNDTGTRTHLYTNRCRGCCENQAFHDRRFTPQSLCRQSWTPWPGNPKDDPTVPRCKSCLRLHAAWVAATTSTEGAR